MVRRYRLTQVWIRLPHCLESGSALSASFLIASVCRFAIGLSALVCAPVLAALPVLSADAGVLVLGRISDDPRTDHEQLQPLLDYVVPRMAGVGIREGRILMAKDARQMASYLRRSRVDWVTEAAGTAMLLEQRAGARPLLLAERNSAMHQRTVFFARRDSRLRSLDELRGHSIAFQRPSSTCGYLMPAAELLRRGLGMEILLSPADPVVPGAVGYLFARSELNISAWVHQGLVDVGVMSNLDWDSPRRMPAAMRADFVIIGQTADYPRAVELVRGDLAPRVQARLREVLLEAAADPDAHEALVRFFNTTRFVGIDRATQRTLKQLGGGVGRIHAEAE
jgi:phosphonate transport system substrate-binding protein